MIDIPTSLNEIFIGEPAPLTRGRNSGYSQRAAAIIELMKDQPGKWAMFRSDLPRSLAYTTRRNYAGRFVGTEWRLSRNNDGTYTLWVRHPEKES